jgi:hypothetical protein
VEALGSSTTSSNSGGGAAGPESEKRTAKGRANEYYVPACARERSRISVNSVFSVNQFSPKYLNKKRDFWHPRILRWEREE